ncbi:hypothetical protein Kpol_1043p68 [Vanderwaltozyma polyspora DSM 70294]|uniref:histidine kinase n=1 Tax=Vanderwaltozyma polyspora (strain ATCC 22028 / DSM 70294 / BCRC 21397 / CBS 2163 / NBRC 10782 / NRRL Y-8283 / UCD 57-17) TaxID=436907 RepID=A7TIT5_VANPO|nr:uncharacterized protein Kpol_1043p68 [Vanderwaltozyma polyspora DSM 70294]EDO17877.1 hypothetical protein Kpol_1043p68 [Vanderwaltozyma polyspora DSM 70294]
MLRACNVSIWKAPYKVKLRTQLTTLVCFVAIISLLILAISTGVYFTKNYRDLRLQQLYIAARLKSSQIDQTINLLYYQCVWLTRRDEIESALTDYTAGNRSAENWASTSDVLSTFLESSVVFLTTTLYDSQFNLILNETNNETNDYIPDDVLSHLLPLSGTDSLPSYLGTTGLLTDPVLNDSTYLMSMSLPIIANPSVTLSDSRVFGYLTVVMSAETIRAVVNDTTALEKSIVAVISSTNTNGTSGQEYHFVFPPHGASDDIVNTAYPVENSTFLSDAFSSPEGGSINKSKSLYSKAVAIGYWPCSFGLANWVGTVSQPEHVFMSSSIKLTKIIAGTVIAITVFVCVITFPLSRWSVQPIVRLQKATEVISKRDGNEVHRSNSSSSSRSTFSSNRRSKDGRHNSSSYNLYEDVEKYTEIGKANKSTESLSKENITDYSSSNSSAIVMRKNLADFQVPASRRFVKDELSELTETYKLMTDALDEHSQLLEYRVKERTKQLEAAKIEAESANEAKTVFIANVTHELRTPLNGILGMTAIAMEETDMERIQSSLKLIYRSGELLLHILTELLTFSKNVLKQTKLEKTHFCVIDLALQIESIFGKISKDQHVKLSIFILPNKLRSMVLWGDQNRILQVIMNLVSNALKFTPVDGKITVNIKLLGEYDKDRSAAENYKDVYMKEIRNSNGDKIKPLMTLISSKDTMSVADNISNKSVASDTERSTNNTIYSNKFKNGSNFQDTDDAIGVPLDKKRKWVISVEVEDTGPGIEPSLQKSVFEPFVQGDQTLSRQYGGTGLGLSICRQLANLMHGTMKLESEVGVGSKFIFTVPLLQTREIEFNGNELVFEDEFNINSKKNREVKFQEITDEVDQVNIEGNSGVEVEPGKCTEPKKSTESESQAVVPSKSSQEMGNSIKYDVKNFKLLIVEDNKVNQLVVIRMLKLEGIENFTIACDGQEAVEKIKEIQSRGEYYGLVLMDIQMPKVDGITATKIIRQELKYDKPIVALTAFADDSNIQACYKSGMDGFLAKPIKREQLKGILTEFCPKA